MSILSTSPVNTRAFDASIACALGDINAAVIVQQLHYWMGKDGVGTIVNGVKYIYNSYNDWVKQFPWLSVWQFRKAMKLLRDLEIVKVIRYKAKCWNQTNYYTLDRDRLLEIINPRSAESTETVEMRDTASRDEDTPQIEVCDSTLSLIESKKTNQKETAESREDDLSKLNQDSNSTAAASLKNAFNPEESQKQVNTSFSESNGLQARNKAQSEPSQKVVGEESKLGKCSINVTKKFEVVNPRWKSLIEELDSVGVQINKTLVNLVKIYSEEEVKKAISLLKIRKQEKHIPNLGGYFTAALKGNWASSNLISEEQPNSDGIDKGSVFRLWYDLAKELGYCTAQEIRDEEHWVLISGNWEKWHDTVKRGYSVEYLKGVMKRNQNR